MEQPRDNKTFEHDNQSELPSQLGTGNLTVLDLASSSPPDNFNPGWSFYASFTSLCIITLAVALDATSLSVALPIISKSLHGSAITAFWCGTSFLLSSTVFQPTFATLSHILGRKPLLFIALLFFTVGAIVGALAQDFTSLLIGRSIQGIGGGGIISLTEILITDLVPLRERGKWFGFQSLTWALGSVTGPLAVKAYSPVIVGVVVFPETFTIAPASILVGVAVSISGRFRWAIWSGWSLTVLGIGLLYLLGPETSVPAFVFLNLIPGLGMGLLFSSMNLATQAAATEKHVGFAAAMYIFMRSLGQGIGVAVGGVVFQSQFVVELRAYPGLARNATALAQDASGLVQVIKAMPEGAPERISIVNAYADALKVVWAVMAGLAFVAFVLSFGTKGLSLSAEMETKQGLKERGDQQRHDQVTQ
ncbi:Major facilitator superfamily domain, general substrate transporter [Lasallia pustulata]|uniref:Major facilitator superfamily domain, general substrate transporter n=1 Tax=Lasallia pustulata TaxID=136370 RepID=A0A1W5D8R4_9LECA|nr:Major facilitator superfamily domain, general substrate transporter [Lasallia pustulata]